MEFECLFFFIKFPNHRPAKYNHADMKPHPRKVGLFLIITSILFAACAIGPDPDVIETPQPTDSVVAATSVSTDIPVPENTTLTIWVAPEFAPDPDTAAGALLADRLQEFEAQYQRVDINVRVKNARGQGGLLDSLVATSLAAPGILPDLITLDPTGVNFSVVNDLISPLDDLLDAPEAPEWYEFASQSAWVDGKFVAHPFASTTEVLGYSTTSYETPPSLWEDLISADQTFLFPAGDPEALFTIAQYLSIDGQLADENGQAMLEQGALAQVLSIYQAAREAGVLPLKSLNFRSSSETADELEAGQVASSSTPFARFMNAGLGSNTAALPVPSPDQLGVALTETWSWGVVTKDTERQALIAELLLWLNDPAFLGAWTKTLGMLPPTSAALNEWPDGEESALASSLVTLAIPKPSQAIIDSVSDPIFNAVIAVIEGLESPASAAIQAAEALQEQ